MINKNKYKTEISKCIDKCMEKHHDLSNSVGLHNVDQYILEKYNCQLKCIKINTMTDIKNIVTCEK